MTGRNAFSAGQRDRHVKKNYFRACIVNIKSSKTDPFGYGCTIRLPLINSTLCPFSALRHHLKTHPTGTGPLYTFQKQHIPHPTTSQHHLKSSTATQRLQPLIPNWSSHYSRSRRSPTMDDSIPWSVVKRLLPYLHPNPRSNHPTRIQHHFYNHTHHSKHLGP